jgi:hypothetical protein
VAEPPRDELPTDLEASIRAFGEAHAGDAAQTFVRELDLARLSLQAIRSQDSFENLLRVVFALDDVRARVVLALLAMESVARGLDADAANAWFRA